MKKVLFNCGHHEASGGGGYYAYQLIHAVSKFAKVFLTNGPLKIRFKNNPELIFEYENFEGQKIDYFFDIDWFRDNSYGGVKNIKAVFFPRWQRSSEYKYDQLITLSKFSQKWIKNIHGEESVLCSPYSKELKPGEKQKNTIAYVGNFAYSQDTGHSKGQEVLISTFKNLPKDWELNLIGNPVSMSFVDRLREEALGYNVNFHLAISDEDKEAILRKSEFFWSANGFAAKLVGSCEHFGIAAEEAIKCGCLTYVHNSGGCKDFCRSWDSPEELFWMTSKRLPNKENVKFQTPENMTKILQKIII